MRVYPLKFSPIFKEKVWGGRRLAEFLDKDIPKESPVGESWEISTVEGSESVISNGPLAGKKLSEVVRENPDEILGAERGKHEAGEFPLLIKFIDAADDLSVQVHPSAEDLKKPLIRKGREKNEGWFIIHAEKGAKLVAGICGGITKNRFEKAAGSGEIEKALRSIPVKTGDAVFLPAGALHAIGKGIVLYEIQQPSDTTFRVWDYNRPGLDGKPRPLHLEEAVECIKFGKRSPRKLRGRIMGRRPERIRYFDNGYFSLEMLSARKNFDWPYRKGVPRVVTVLAGGLTFQGSFGTVRLGGGETALLPAGLETPNVKSRLPLIALIARPK